MKKLKTLSILLVFVMTLSIGSIAVTAAEEALLEYGGQVINRSTEGVVAWEMFGIVEHGTVTANRISDTEYELVFLPDPGYRLDRYDSEVYFLNENKSGDLNFRSEVNGSEVRFIMTVVAGEEEELVHSWDDTWVITRDQYVNQYHPMNTGEQNGWISEVVKVLEAFVYYTDGPEEPQPLPDLYTVRVESNPAGVATFSGYGTGFQDGDAYNVAVTSADPNYAFTGWVGSPSGTISGADVSLVANFEQVVFEDEKTPEALEVRYEVSAVSQPAGVGTFTGEGLFRSGDSFNVQVATVMEGYEFLRWDTINAGVIDGADFEVIAVFGEITEDEPIQQPTEEPDEEPVEEVLDEEIPEDVDTLPETSGVPFAIFGAIGAVISGGGLYIRKKK